MPDEERSDSTREERVDSAIAAYLTAVDAGRTPDRDEFLARHTDLRDELEAFFADGERFERVAGPIRDAVTPPDRPGHETTTSPSRARTIPLVPGQSSSAPSHGRIGDHELLEEIARGGMGVVYKARQVKLNRIVALKMILAGRLASDEDVHRFRAEAEAAAQLDHPGIVAIFEVGEHEGQQYFSMGYVDGASLADRLREGPLAPRETAALLSKVCDAVQYAHEHDVIHRDLKPANILLEKGGPRITDFGLAKRLESGADLTGTGQILGTPAYMSPEQASGGTTHRIGPATDVYSLGAILYQLLTGRPPFHAETRLATLSQLLDSDPVPPRHRDRDVPRDLDAVCMKCLERDPARRYPSARELGEELNRYLEGETVRAAKVGLLGRVVRALRHGWYEEHFRGWGLGLMAVGLVIFLSHVAIHVVEGERHGSWSTYFLLRSGMFAALLFTLWGFRRHSLLPTKSAERLVWVVWIGYLLGLGAINAASLVLGHDQREAYASFSVLAGLGFFIMGGHVWGGGYVVGLAFLSAAPVLAHLRHVAPLLYGALWAGALFAFGIHYRRGGAAREQNR